MSKVAVVHSSYYPKIISNLLKGIERDLDKSFSVDSFPVPGAWEIITKINRLSKNYDKFIAVAIICKGHTDHYEYISTSVNNGLINLTIGNNIYIANCVLNVTSLNQAKNRSRYLKNFNDDKNKGSEAAKAINLLFT